MKTLLLFLTLAVPVAVALRATDVRSGNHPSPEQRPLPTADVPHRHTASPGRLVTATSYSWREPQHRCYGRLSALGTPLDDTQISADWRYYPPRTVIWVQGLGFRTVTDRGSAVRGPRHIDIHFSSLAAMRAWGTRLVHIQVIRTP